MLLPIGLLYDGMNSDKYIIRYYSYNITKAFIYHIDSKELRLQEKRIKTAEIHRVTNRLLELQKTELYNLLGDNNGEKFDLSDDCPFGKDFPNPYSVDIDNIREFIYFQITSGESYFKLKDQIKLFKRKYSEYPRVYNED